MGTDAGRGLDSIGLPVIATVARLPCSHATGPRRDSDPKPRGYLTTVS